MRTECVKGVTRLADPAATPQETWKLADALAKEVFPREPAPDAVRRLHGLSHTEALQLGQQLRPIRPAFDSAAEHHAFEHGWQRKHGLEDE